jgi:hypothetical protein
MTNFKRRGAAALALVLLAAPLTGAQTVPARDAPRFFGTWRLVSDTQTGIMIYDSLGNMAAQVMPNRRLVFTPSGSTNKIVWERAR